MNFLLLSFALLSPAWALLGPDTVTITAGVIQGASCPNSAATKFLNIPFAEPPTGDLRFASPQNYSGKFPSGTYDATTPGPACIQFGNTFLENTTTSEDCLHLDVFVPPLAGSASAFPVKVWIYGGGEDAGGISNPLYDGCNLAEDDSIMVSINYRLGPLGFLALETAGIGGNFGIQDIIMGLQWIQTNIAAFGGDPKKVMLFGQSAGATNVFIISSLPQATSLISSAISESGGGRDLATNAVLQSVGTAFATSLNCSVTDAPCLRSKSTAQLNASEPEGGGISIYSSLNPNNFQPYVDGKTIPENPSAVGTKVPTIYGSNANEGALFVLGQFQSPNISVAQYNSFLQSNFGPAAQTVGTAYSLDKFAASPIPVFTAISTIITDVSYFCPAYRAMNLAAQNGIPTWTYLWNHTSSCAWFDFIPQDPLALELLSATHTAEIPFVFGNLDNLPHPDGTCNMTSQEGQLSKSIILTWNSMAANGAPDGSGQAWPVWNATTMQGVIINNSTSVGVVNYTVCEQLWDTLDTKLLNFTTTTNTTTTGAPTGSTTPTGVPTGSATTTGNPGTSTTLKSAASQRLASTTGTIVLVMFSGLMGFL